MDGKLNEKIIELLENSKPMTVKEIAGSLFCTQASVIKAVNELANSQKLSLIKTPNRVYYYISGGTSHDDLSNMKTIIAQETVKTLDASEDLKDAVKEVENKLEETNNKINSIYLNIISLMGIFVAIFSIISINVKEISQIASNPGPDAIRACIIIDASAIVVIGVLLWLIRRFILSPVKKK